MIKPFSRSQLQLSWALAAFVLGGGVWAAGPWPAQAADAAPASLEASFQEDVKPLFDQACVACHNEDLVTSGVSVERLDATVPDRYVRLWESVRHNLADGSMPPKELPQPTGEARRRALQWIDQALEAARMRPAPKNGLVRRLTVAQYRNTLRELLLLEDDLTDILPPDAVSKDGFVNNIETLQLSPLQMEAYLEIAEEALNRSIVDPDSKPSIQKFRVDLGESINPAPLPEELILGANSMLVDNSDYTVTQLTAEKPFDFDPFMMRTQYRFIEGYKGNATVRGWRDFDSIYHAVFACMRGSRGYPKGDPYNAVPEALLLRPAIPTDELFGSDGTFGPRANFKISLRELPDDGRFRVTVTAAKYNDGLLLDKGATPAPEAPGTVVARNPKTPQTVTIPKAGVYQVDLYTGDRNDASVEPDSSRLTEALSGSWPLNGEAPGTLAAEAHFVDSPFGGAVSLDGNGDFITIPRDESMNVGEGDFTVAAWIYPLQLKRAGIVSLEGADWKHGWHLEMTTNKGVLRLETAGPDNESNGAVSSGQGVIRARAWNHVAAVVNRAEGRARLYVNGYLTESGEVGPANLDNPKADLLIGRLPDAQEFRGDIDEVKLYRRALGEAEIQALVEPGRSHALPPPEKLLELTLNLGDRQFSGAVPQPAFLVARLDAGELAVSTKSNGVRSLERVVLTPLAVDSPVAQRFLAFEKRSPLLGVHLGLRRDCGSTFAPVESPKTVSSGEFQKFVFEGAIRNYPSPEVEKDNVNYLAGIREIAVRNEYTDGRDMPRLAIRSVEFEGPFYDAWPPRSHQTIFIDSERKSDGAAYAREVIRNFATRAYRRPITDAEETALMNVFEDSFKAEGDFQQGVKNALQVVLTSPQFLYLVETSATPEAEPLDDYELASKLSYFLWNGPPDAELLDLAAKGSLRQRLDAEVERMVKDSRFSRFSREFTSQWLSLEKFDVLEPDRERYPALTRDVRKELRKEPIEFLQYLVRENRPARELVDSDVVMANEVVASYYNLGGKTESGFEFVPIVHERKELGGVLTEAAIMAGLSDGRESNPVKRGAWLARKIISEPPADPPPNVPALTEDTQGLSLRERIFMHRNQPGCKQCHTKIDPWGVAMEEFDAGGRLKREPVDAQSTLPDATEVSGAEDLKRYLAEDRIDQVAYSVLKHLSTYANGRTLAYSELHRLKQDQQELAAAGYRMQDMIRYVVHSPMFLEK